MRRCKCGAQIEHIGICSACYEAGQLKAHWASMGKALMSVPSHYRGNEWGSMTLYERCPSLRYLESEEGGALTPAVLMSARMIVLHGESGSGKTSLAVALYNWIIGSTSPSSDTGIIARAQGARFVDARDIHPHPAHEGVPVDVVARRAPVLILDDAGAEGGAGESYDSHDRYRRVADILAHRDKHDLFTIVTTPGEYGHGADAFIVDRWAHMYGGGVMRRYLESPDSKIIYLEREDRIRSRMAQ